jgi:hypothetical protein
LGGLEQVKTNQIDYDEQILRNINDIEELKTTIYMFENDRLDDYDN